MSQGYNDLIELSGAILKLETHENVVRFFDDLCTPAENRAMKERWKVCQLLEEGKLSYREIQKITKASLATIGRVSRFLKDEKHNGYRIILDKIKMER